VRWTLVLVIVLGAACGSHGGANGPKPATSAPRVVGWRKLGEWSGRGNLQTASMETVTGQLRVRWRATAIPAAAASGVSSGPGMLRISANSAISGRLLQVAVEHDGPGAGVGDVTQDPHDLYMVVESSNLDWSFTVEEAVSGTASQ
jgi:hypothetical protein